MYICAEVVDDVCSSWIPFTGYLGINEGDALLIGASLFGVTIVAWGVKMVASLILNKW